ncbi:hypothetical protein I79_021587 [Cricetulus griseus]|uniref:Uncharacterized protein n=1 Tax=Cricetulus griseus TaxID=10029 RepID=G3ID24_CRIGR|nr:hypothetical protein I79_021587 [Cricetulus griseus]
MASGKLTIKKQAQQVIGYLHIGAITVQGNVHFILYMPVAVMVVTQLLKITGFQWQASAVTIIIIISSKTIAGSILG